ncbi:hypothetical protein [Wenzhouxiangella sp. EGI_FJ10409]|uniref:hypothetical protein n=1 Tax=Wenzhouxiangella sp. EGI_FJ10409 TaxID=3243767 RepID=UPI0035D7BFAA
MSATAILVSTVLIVLLVVAIALLTASIALLTGRPGRANTSSGGLLEALQLLDRQWRIERLVYRHHRIFGLLVLLASAFCLWQIGRSELAGYLHTGSAASAMVWLVLIAQACNLLIGLTLLLRPSLLKPIEAVGNRWHRLESSAGRPKALRATAVLLALVGLAVLLASATLLLQQIDGLVGHAAN